MVKLKLQYFGFLMWKADSLEKTLMLGKIEGRRRREWQKLRWLESFTNSMDMNLSKLWEIVKESRAWHAALHEVAKSQTQLSDETTTNSTIWKEDGQLVVYKWSDILNITQQWKQNELLVNWIIRMALPAKEAKQKIIHTIGLCIDEVQ